MIPMNNMQKIKSIAKKHSLLFVPTNSTLNGARLYNFETNAGYIVAANWTISSAINELNFGDLDAKIS
jgi:hypothetical protein